MLYSELFVSCTPWSVSGKARQMQYLDVISTDPHASCMAYQQADSWQCAALAAAAGVTAAAAPKSPAEAVQVAALEALIAIASGSDGATLGSGWPSVLRTLSNLHTLQVQMYCHDVQSLKATLVSRLGFMPVRTRPCNGQLRCPALVS